MKSWGQCRRRPLKERVTVPPTELHFARSAMPVGGRSACVSDVAEHHDAPLRDCWGIFVGCMGEAARINWIILCTHQYLGSRQRVSMLLVSKAVTEQRSTQYGMNGLGSADNWAGKRGGRVCSSLAWTLIPAFATGILQNTNGPTDPQPEPRKKDTAMPLEANDRRQDRARSLLPEVG